MNVEAVNNAKQDIEALSALTAAISSAAATSSTATA